LSLSLGPDHNFVESAAIDAIVLSFEAHPAVLIANLENCLCLLSRILPIFGTRTLPLPFPAALGLIWPISRRLPASLAVGVTAELIQNVSDFLIRPFQSPPNRDRSRRRRRQNPRDFDAQDLRQ
jgi:hypothetical protein